MQTRIKVYIAIIVGLIGCIILINGMYEPSVDTNENTTTRYVDFDVIDTTTTETTNITKRVVKTTHKTTTKKVVKTASSYSNGYRLTHYGYDCKGCGGRTATGYDISKTIYYNDSTYGKVRIVAMCSKIPLYSIIKIKNYKLGGDILAIVIDRGVGCNTIDLAVENEKASSKYGIQNNVKIEILRKGK